MIHHHLVGFESGRALAVCESAHGVVLQSRGPLVC